MSQFDLTQLSKKNQEFVRIAKHQLLENGKTEEEAESLIQEILPAIHENQGKGIPARTLFGAPTVWANSFSEKERYEKEDIRFNGQLRSSQIDRYCPLTDSASRLLGRAFDRISFSARSYHKILKVSRTIADMEGEEVIASHHIAEALSYRAFEKDSVIK